MFHKDNLMKCKATIFQMKKNFFFVIPHKLPVLKMKLNPF
jgi:hypothetical protein